MAALSGHKGRAELLKHWFSTGVICPLPFTTWGTEQCQETFCTVPTGEVMLLASSELRTQTSTMPRQCSTTDIPEPKRQQEKLCPKGRELR